MKYKSHKQEIFLTEYLFPIIALVLSCVTFFVLRNYKDQFPHTSMLIYYVLVVWLPEMIYWIFRIRIPPLIKIVVYIFVTLAMPLANTFNLYAYLPDYDTVLHFLSGLLICLLVLYLIVRSGHYEKISDGLKLVILLLSSQGVGAFWEIVEYLVDAWTNSNAQHYIEEGLVDTMHDLIADSLGGLVFCFLMCMDILLNKKRMTDKIADKLSVYSPSDYRFRKKKD
jgi:hypothetical protein